MSIVASSLIAKASLLLQDPTNVRWSASEMLDWLNDAQRQIVLLIPEANVVAATLTPVAGTKQVLPTDAARLVRVVRNTGGAAIRLVDQAALDAANPSWHTDTAASIAKNYTFDGRSPKIFYVYPPASGSGSYDILYSQIPAPLALVSANITLDDLYGAAIVDYLLYRAFLKDAEYAAEDTRSQGAWAAFMASLTGRRDGDQLVEPKGATSR